MTLCLFYVILVQISGIHLFGFHLWRCDGSDSIIQYFPFFPMVPCPSTWKFMTPVPSSQGFSSCSWCVRPGWLQACLQVTSLATIHLTVPRRACKIWWLTCWKTNKQTNLYFYQYCWWICFIFILLSVVKVKWSLNAYMQTKWTSPLKWQGEFYYRKAAKFGLWFPQGLQLRRKPCLCSDALNSFNLQLLLNWK